MGGVLESVRNACHGGSNCAEIFEMPIEKPVILRRTMTPYVGQTVILAGVTILLMYVALSKHAWDGLLLAALVWTLFAAYVLIFGMKDRIFWDNGGVIMRASGGPERRIGYAEITEVRYEVGGSPSQSRPFRQIVILGRPHSSKTYIDVSLRHFRIEGIKSLLDAIRERRPDLAFPRLPLNL